MRQIIRVLFATLFVILAASPLVASGSGEESAEEESILVFGLSGSPDTLDPHATTGTLTFQTMRSVYDTLIEPNRAGELVPALAESWESRDDSLVWEFRLRDDVTFHHGRSLSAVDVVASLRRLQDESFASPSAFEYDVISAVRATDDRTVVIELSEPHAPLLATLASGWSAILPADLIEAGHDFGAQPVGTGPFRFVEWIRDGEIVLERNPSYWMDGKPLIDGVRFRIVTEQSVKAQALVADQIDVADIVVEPELSMLRNAAGVQLYESTSALVMVLAINTRRTPFDELRVRQAINAAIDKQAVMDTAYAGGVEVATFMDAGNPYYRDFTDMYEYDPEAAARVADEIDFDREWVITLPRNFEPHVRAGEMYHEMLRQAGFPVRIQLVEWSTWIGDVYREAQFDLTVIGHTGTLDPHGRLARYGTAETYVGWEDPTTAEAIEAARRTGEPERRREFYDIALERMARELPFIFVGSPYRYIGLDESIRDFHMDSQLDTFDLRDVHFE
ncbi:MAG: ABC transporter substrate-binding protein [Spirochaetales bacterium]|nr:ABC transporter substrate-binding protein [Spirochaetales bacterium]